MGALTFDALLRSLKPEGGAPDLVYYLHGDEDILKDEALRALTARAMEAAARDFNVDTRSAADLDAATLRALVDTPPLLAQPRVVALAQELDKLAAVTAGRTATHEDVAALAGVRRGQTMHHLVDAALERRAADAARLVEHVLEQAGVTGVRILTALGTALIGTALARAELDRGTPRSRLTAILLQHLRLARPFGLGDWGETAARRARGAEGWSSREVGQAVRLARDAGRALKATTGPDEAGVLAPPGVQLGVLGREGGGSCPLVGVSVERVEAR